MVDDRSVSRGQTGSAQSRPSIKPVDPEEVRRKMRLDYIKSRNEKPFKTLEVIQGLMLHAQRPDVPVNEILQETANIVHKHFSLRTATIGLRSETDSKYRYVVNAGLRPEPWETHLKEVYDLDDFVNFKEYNGYEISRLTRVYLEEHNPMTQEERKAYNRPALLDLKRRALDDNLEADYVDTLIYGPEDDLIGWLEYSGTVGGKLPDPMTIKYIETISMILGMELSRRHGPDKKGTAPGGTNDQ